MKKPQTPHSLLSAAAVVAVAGGLLAACAQTVSTHGQVILPSRVAQIKPGLSTRADVQQLLGTPSTTGTFSENRWYYITSTTKSEVLKPNQLEKREVLIVDFDPSGTVAGLSQRTEADAKDIEPSRKTTKTHGQSLGILDQMLGNLGFGAK